MAQHVVFLLLGLSSGAVFAALALGLVLTYRSSGVINFATSSIAVLTAYVYAELRQGQLVSLVPGTAPTLDLGGPVGFVPALLIALAVSALTGLLLYACVFRPLRHAPPVAGAVASLGVAVVITALLTARLGTVSVPVEPIFPIDAWIVAGVRLSSDRAYLAVTIVLVALLLTAVLRFTRFGLATRAAAESEKGAYVVGLSPDRLAAANWVLGSVVAGLAGILVAPIVPLVPIAYTLFIVPALAAAVVGSFQHLGPAVLAGLGIGMLQSEAQYLQSTHDRLPSSGLPELVPLVLVLLVLVVRARPLPSRGAIVTRTLGRAPRPQSVLLSSVTGSVLCAAALVVLDDRWRAALIVSLVYGVISLSLVVVTGYAGQVSLAQLTIAGVAGFLVGPLAQDVGIPFPVAPLVAALAATVLGVVVGLPALRIRGLTVAVVTFALAFALEALWFRNLDFVSSSGVEVEPPRLFGLDLGIGEGTAFPRISFGLLCLAVLVAVGVGVARLRTSSLGAQMLAVRANERSAGASGVDVVRVKLAAFAIGAFIAGLGGSLLAYRQGNVTFDAFTTLGGLALFTTVYLAGITSVSGGVLAGFLSIGGLAYVAADELFSTGIWYDVVAGLLLVVTVVLNPEGLVGPAHQVLEQRRTARSRSASALPEQVVPTVPDSRGPRVQDDTVVLSVRDVRVRYGGVVAVDGVGFDVRRGSIVGLIGPNGAGKTTLIDALTGLTPCTGTVALLGQDLAGRRPFQRVRQGLGRTFQAIELYEDLSVEENVKVGLTASTGRPGREVPAAVLDETFALLGLTPLRDRPAGELSQGQRQLVSIARALAGRPAVLLLDEPAGGLDTVESHWLGQRLRDVRDSGVAIVLVDHDMGLVLGLCDEVQVLDFGKVIASGTPAQVRASREVASAYLGTTHAQEVLA